MSWSQPPPQGMPPGPHHPPVAPPPPQQAPRKRRGPGVFIGVVGCAVLILGLVGLVGLGATWVVMSDHKTTEKPKYPPVKDDRNGPSIVKPGGDSGKKLKTKRGAIRKGAKQIHKASRIDYPANPKSCREKENLTDVFKNVVFDIDRQMRKDVRLSEKEETKLGDRIAKEIERHPKFKGKIDTPRTYKWRKYIARVSQPLLAEIKRDKIKYKFHVIDSPIVNAFAIPGGHVYFFTGMLENKGGTWLENEAQLASIVAHEISHIDLGHTAAVYEYLKSFGLDEGEGQQLARIAVALARHPFSSAQEDEADVNATKMLYWAQYSPKEFVDLWLSWDKQQPKRQARDGITKEIENLLRTHSTPKKRACNVMAATREIMERDKFDRFYVGRSNFKKKKARTAKQY